MKASVRTDGVVTIVDLNGKITIGEGDVLLRDTVEKVINDGGKQILLNLGKVSYMDSAGIGELVACYKRAKENGGQLKLLNPTGKVFDLLQLTKLEEIFETYRDEMDAIRSF